MLPINERYKTRRTTHHGGCPRSLKRSAEIEAENHAKSQHTRQGEQGIPASDLHA